MVEEKQTDKPKSDDGLIDKAVAAAERLEKANAEYTELLRRQQEFAAKQALAGRAEAGLVVQEETEEEAYIKRAKERYAGTGLDPTKK